MQGLARTQVFACRSGTIRRGEYFGRQYIGKCFGAARNGLCTYRSHCDVAARGRAISEGLHHRYRSARQARVLERATCMALPSTVDGAVTVSAPSKPVKDISVPANLAAVSELVAVPGGKGRAVELKSGQYFKIVNTHGEQVQHQWHECMMYAMIHTSRTVHCKPELHDHVLYSSGLSSLLVQRHLSVCQASMQPKTKLDNGPG